MPETAALKARRHLFVLALGMAMSLVLSGCMKMEMGVDIKSDDDIRVKMMIGMERNAAATMAEDGEELTPEDLCVQAGNDTGVRDATVKDVSDDKYIACEMSGTTDLKSMADSLEHADGTYTFAMASDEGDSSAGGADAFDSFKMAVTFPGKVVEHNGSSTVDGTTVTWTDPNDMYGSEGLRAVGKDTASSSGWLWLLLAGIGVVVVAAVVVLLLVLRGRRGTSAAPVQPYLPPNDPQPGPPQPGQQPPPPSTGPQ